MEIPVLIEEVPGKGFVATAPALGWSAEGPTSDAAVANLRAETGRRIAAASQVVWIDLPIPHAATVGARPDGAHPLGKWAGTQDPNDPAVQEWRKLVEEHRQLVDAADAVTKAP
jgi:hypothetical protein